MFLGFLILLLFIFTFLTWVIIYTTSIWIAVTCIFEWHFIITSAVPWQRFTNGRVKPGALNFPEQKYEMYDLYSLALLNTMLNNKSAYYLHIIEIYCFHFYSSFWQNKISHWIYCFQYFSSLRQKKCIWQNFQFSIT